MKKLLLFLIALIPFMSFANDGIKIDYTDGVCQCFGAEHSSTTLNVYKPGTFWALDNGCRWPRAGEWVIHDRSFFESSVDESRKDFDRLVQEIKDNGHSSAINEYYKGSDGQAIFLNSNVEKIKRL